ncbi:MAG: hypothetical protein AAB268_00305 [Elusimicrobiota bacterium]
MSAHMSRIKKYLTLLFGAIPVLNSMGQAYAQDSSKVYGTPESIAPKIASKKDLLRLSLSNTDIPPSVWDKIAAVAQLAEDVFVNPAVAFSFSHDPQRYLASIGAQGITLDPNSLEVRIALALGDVEIREAVQANNTKGFLLALERRGILKSPDVSIIVAQLQRQKNALENNSAETDGVAVALAVAFLVASVVSTAAAAVNVAAAATVVVYAAALVKTAGANELHASDAPPFALGRAMGGDEFGASLQNTFIREKTEEIAQAIEKMAAYEKLKSQLSGNELRDAVRSQLHKQMFGKSRLPPPAPSK